MLDVEIGNLDPLAVKMLTIKKKLSHETEGFYWVLEQGFVSNFADVVSWRYVASTTSAVYCYFGSDKIRKLNKNTKTKKENRRSNL